MLGVHNGTTFVYGWEIFNQRFLYLERIDLLGHGLLLNNPMHSSSTIILISCGRLNKLQHVRSSKTKKTSFTLIDCPALSL